MFVNDTLSDGFTLDAGVTEHVMSVLTDERAVRAGFYAFHEADTIEGGEIWTWF